MSAIHHFYRAYHIVFHDGRYTVHNDTNPADPFCDVTLNLPYLKVAKRYIDVLWDAMLNPQPEPLGSLRFEPFYRSYHRGDGPFPAMFRPRNQAMPGRCHHFGCRTDLPGLHQGNLWCYCNEPVANAGTTRCLAHQDTPERYQPRRANLD